MRNIIVDEDVIIIRSIDLDEILILNFDWRISEFEDLIINAGPEPIDVPTNQLTFWLTNWQELVSYKSAEDEIKHFVIDVYLVYVNLINQSRLEISLTNCE